MKHTMRRVLAAALTAALLLTALTGCNAVTHGVKLTDTTRDEHNKASLSAPIPLSGFEDVTNAKGVCTYQIFCKFLLMQKTPGIAGGFEFIQLFPNGHTK